MVSTPGIWTYGDPSGKFRKEAILARDQYSALSDRLLVAYIGKPHDSNDVNSRQVDDFLAGRQSQPVVPGE